MGKIKDRFMKRKEMLTIHYQIISLHEHLAKYAYLLSTEQANRVYAQIDELQAKLDALKGKEASK